MKKIHVNLLIFSILASNLSISWAEQDMSSPMDSMDSMDHSKNEHSQSDHEMKKMATDKEMASTPMSIQGGDALLNARDPKAYSDGYDFGLIPRPVLGDEHNFASLLVNRFEYVKTNDNIATNYDLQAWYGRDYDRAVLKAEGDIDDGKLQEARTELLWGHAIAPFWDTQLGVRYDNGVEPDRTWLAFGIQGLAPYWFEVDVAAYVGKEGRTALRLESEYELLLTQKLILQPRIETNIYGKSDGERGLGSGLSDISAGIRLRYEIKRELAPYIGVEWSKQFGGTKDFTKAEGGDANKLRLIAGLRFWF